MTTIEQIASQAMALNAKDRADIARILLTSLESLHYSDYEEEWIELAHKRRQDILSHKVNPVEWEDIKSFVKK